MRGDCTSCHSLSRAGTRLGYSRCVAGNCGNLFAGFMKYDVTTGTWIDTVDANNQQIRGSYTTFAPVGNPFPTDEQSLAIVDHCAGWIDKLAKQLEDAIGDPPQATTARIAA